MSKLKLIKKSSQRKFKLDQFKKTKRDAGNVRKKSAIQDLNANVSMFSVANTVNQININVILTSWDNNKRNLKLRINKYLIRKLKPFDD